MGIAQRRRPGGVGVNVNLNGNVLNLDHQINGPSAAGPKGREPLQSKTQDGIQRTVDEAGDSDAGSSLLDDLDLDEEDQDVSERRMRAEAKSIRKVTVPCHLLV